jgi:hypothetical protein
MTHTLRLELDLRPVHRVGADVLVIPFVPAHGLGRGPLAWADWRLCGLLSETLRRDAGSGKEAVLLAPSGGRLRADWILALEIAENITDEGLRRLAEGIVERVRSLQVSRLALALPTAGDPARVSEAFAVGLMASVVRMKAPLEARVVVPRETARHAWAGLERAAQAPLPGVALQLSAPADPRGEPRERAAAPVRSAL